MSRKILFTVAVFFLLGSAGAQSVSYEKYELPNGMTVILHVDHNLPVSVVNIWYYVGSKDEVEGRSGFAHLFEHLMFMGTERVPGSDFDNIMEKYGGWNNASTSYDRTNYYSYGPSGLIHKLLWLDADRLEDLGRMMTGEKLEKQRDVVRNERRQGYENAPYGEAEVRIPALMYPEGHPYHDPVIGSHKDLEAATVEDVKDFFATYYVPANASLVVAGDFNPTEVKPWINELFGTLPRGSEPLHRTAPPVQLDRVLRTTLSDDVQLPRTYIVYHSPALYDPGDAELDLAAAILTSGIPSRLYQALIYEEQLAVDVNAYQQSSMLGSLFQIQATARPGVDLSRIEDTIDRVVAEISDEGPGPDELERHKADIEYEAIRQLESILGKADALNRYQFFFGEPDSFERDLERYRQASVVSVRDAVRDWLDPDRRLILRVLPELPKSEANPRDVEPGLGKEGDFTPPMPATFQLSNGITVHHWKRGELPLVEVLALLSGGADSDGSRPGLAALTADMLDEGAGDLTAIEFRNALDTLGARLAPRAGRDHSQVALSVLKRNYEKALVLMADAVQRPRFDEQEWNRVQQLQVEDLKRALDNPLAVASVAGMRHFFGENHPYSRPVEGTPSSVEDLDLRDIRSWYETLYSPENTTILITGDLDASEAKLSLEKAFGGWRKAGEAMPRPNIPELSRDGLEVAVVDRPEAVQTVIAFYMPAPSYDSPDRVPLEMIGTILGGTFTSRLNQDLREEHGFTYGAGASFQFGREVGYLVARSSVQSTVTGPATGEFLKEFQGIREGDITSDEVEKARANYRTDLLQAYSTLGSLLATSADLVRKGRDFDSPAADLAKSLAITRSDLNSLVQKAVRIDKALLLLVGDKKLILEQIQGLDLPEPIELTVAGGAR